MVPERSTSTGDLRKFFDFRSLPESTGTGGRMYYEGTYGLAKVEEGIARMEMEAVVTLDPPSPDIPGWPEAMAPRRKFLHLKKGSCRAWERIRVDTGVVLESEHETTLDLAFVRPDGKGEVPIPTKVVQRAKLLR